MVRRRACRQSRWGINVTEDMGGGLRALVTWRTRFNTDTGAQATANYFQQSLGRPAERQLRPRDARAPVRRPVRRGDQHLWVVSLLAYFDAFKPEIGFSLGARASGMIKYAAEYGGFRGGLQYSFDEDAPPQGRTVGAYLRYATGGLIVGGAFQSCRVRLGPLARRLDVGRFLPHRQVVPQCGLRPATSWTAARVAAATDLAVLSSLCADGSSVANGNFGETGRPWRPTSATSRPSAWATGDHAAAQPRRTTTVPAVRAHELPVMHGRTSSSFAAGYALSRRTDSYAELDTTRLKARKP